MTVKGRIPHQLFPRHSTNNVDIRRQWWSEVAWFSASTPNKVLGEKTLLAWYETFWLHTNSIFQHLRCLTNGHYQRIRQLSSKTIHLWKTHFMLKHPTTKNISLPILQGSLAGLLYLTFYLRMMPEERKKCSLLALSLLQCITYLLFTTSKMRRGLGSNLPITKNWSTTWRNIRNMFKKHKMKRLQRIILKSVFPLTIQTLRVFWSLEAIY